ncbi:Piso0_001398 [Millerozyma farinosa CBS 7064]|uniref:Piso0_001398 protein n=1 Tax=Pichia sorbitophila (strain ATCC MYA-4447 / BCRC 22081 / CBS 7064 / NBRC 10061 / NRRL Y-12695) TaxID=559304 RepID=G8YN23_PICSO|nr:Piso0_001398 [Millerozyma farinosa CBS 7064]
MSADYWSSSQRMKWQFNRQTLLDYRRKLLILERKMIQSGLIKDYQYVNYDWNMRIYLHNVIVKLGRRLNIRQVVLATAEVYLTRFLTKVSVKEVNVYLLVAACVYASCKIEECPQHIRLILSEARSLWPEYIPHDTAKLAEFEFYLLEEMNLYLILHHPYRSLLQIQTFLKENYDTYAFVLTDDELQNSWSLISDSYITDLHLLYPPHIIAITVIYITIVLKKNSSSLKSNGNSIDADVNEKPQSGSIESQNDPSAMEIEDLMTLSSSNPQEEPLAQPVPGATQLEVKSLSKIDQDTIRINKFMKFLNHSHINLDEVAESIQDMVNLYVVWNHYNENLVKKSLHRMLTNS